MGLEGGGVGGQGVVGVKGWGSRGWWGLGVVGYGEGRWLEDLGVVGSMGGGVGGTGWWGQWVGVGEWVLGVVAQGVVGIQMVGIKG